jgi:hypothetical protein
MQDNPMTNIARSRSSTIYRNLTAKPRANEYFPDPDDADNKSSQASYIMYPESPTRVIWDILTMLIILYQSFTFPYCFAFSTSYRDSLVLDFVATAIFTADIVLNFNTAYYLRGIIITDRKEIALRYLKLWFPIDVISTFPYSWLVEGKAIFTEDGEMVGDSSSSILYSSPSLLRLLRLARIVCLLRVAKIREYLREIEYFFSSNQLSAAIIALRLLTMMLMLSHWIACVWVFISVDNFDTHESWIIRGGYVDSSNFEIYVTAMYWAITSMASVGYGDIKAISSTEKVVSIVCVVVGSGIFTFIISSIGTLVSKHTSHSKLHRERVVKFNSFMKHYAISSDLKFKIRRYMDYVWEKRQVRILHESDVLDLLSDPLRDAVMFSTRGRVLKGCKVFGDAVSGHVLVQMARIIEPRVYAPNDVIFEEGECSYEMHFIILGVVEILHRRTRTVFQNLRDGDNFGQISFFTHQPRKASAHCLEFVETFTLPRTSVDALANRFPEFAKYLEVIREKCKEGDLSGLNISCYMCDKLGHAAVDCKRFVLFANLDDSRAKWLKSYAFRTKLVNPYSLLQEPNFIRRHRQVNITRDLFSKPHEAIGSSYLHTLSTVLPSKTDLSYNAADCESHLEIILSEEESSSDQEEYVIPPAMRRPLIS